MSDDRPVRIMTSGIYDYWAAANVTSGLSTSGGFTLRACHSQKHMSEAEARACPEGIELREIVCVKRDDQAEFAAEVLSQRGKTS